MSHRSWHLNRRTVLQGCGVALGLPFLECMSSASEARNVPKRFCGVYFPYGIVNQKPDSEYSRWNWFPKSEGKDYQFSEALRPLESIREEISILGGLSHPNGRSMGGHDTGDIWLTGAQLKGSNLTNSVSIDQLLAQHNGHLTRYPSLVLSSDGGVGEPTRSSTLSFGKGGQPIPAINKPRQVFDNLFGLSSDSVETRQRQLVYSRQMLDQVLEDSRSLRRRLGTLDRRKFDEYMQSVREIELRVQQSEKWLTIPKPSVSAAGLSLDADESTPQELIRTMYDLIFLAFQTDSTRYATYQLGNMNGATSIAGKFPQLLGFGNNMHSLAHGANKGQGGEKKGKWDQFLAEQLSYFVERLRDALDGEQTLPDSTLILYGSSNSNTHQNKNYPLVVAGGRGLGMQHGAFHKYDESTPMSNLLATILNRLDLPTESFVDSNGELTELL